jgi:hypothetical protein
MYMCRDQRHTGLYVTVCYLYLHVCYLDCYLAVRHSWTIVLACEMICKKHKHNLLQMDNQTCPFIVRQSVILTLLSTAEIICKNVGGQCHGYRTALSE